MNVIPLFPARILKYLFLGHCQIAPIFADQNYIGFEHVYLTILPMATVSFEVVGDSMRDARILRVI